MESHIKIIDNFLPKEEFQNLKNIILSEDFLWFFSEFAVYFNDNYPQRCHWIYEDMQPCSILWNQIKPLLINGLELKNYQSILRIKINATQKTSSSKIQEFHHDLLLDEEDENQISQVSPHNVALLYLNTNNGFTYFEGGEKVESIENRCVLFPGQLLHAGSTCTDQTSRVVLNINYTLS